jgi:hypothetical protein
VGRKGSQERSIEKERATKTKKKSEKKEAQEI